MSRPPLPPHRKRMRIKHGTQYGYRKHLYEPEVYGPVCDACRRANTEEAAKYRARALERRKRLRYMLMYKVDGWINQTDVRPLTTQELDIAVRMIRLLDDQLLDEGGQS